MDVEQISADGIPLNIADAQARQDITEIKSNLTNLIKTKTITGTTDNSSNLAITDNSILPQNQVILCALPVRTESGYYASFYSCKVSTNASGSNFAIVFYNDVSSAKMANQNVMIQLYYMDL